MRSIFTITLKDNSIAFWGNFKLEYIPLPELPIPFIGESLPDTIKAFIESYGYKVKNVALKLKRLGTVKDYTVTLLLEQSSKKS